MKVDINIIPDEQKKERMLERRIGAILRFGFSIFFALIVLSSVLFIAQVILNADYKLAKENSQSRRQSFSRESEQLEDFLVNINLLSQKINKTSRETPRWLKVFARIAETAPPEIKLISVHAEKEHLKISGFSRTREAFLDFQEKLKTEGIKNLTSPVSNVVSPEDFNFEIGMDLDKNFLNQP
jgi:hypothetical protein